ncbi:MAG: metallophosphoesterase, partial [Bacteroidota bacterium]
FVFIHHLVGGFDIDGVARGGVEAAGLYEWGGKSLNGQNEFATKRPGWDMPIHNLLLKYGVNVVFHGHDHFYDYQQLDGIIYQEVPQPSAPENSVPNQAANYGYQQGTILGRTGFLKLSISSSAAKVEYMGTSTANSSLNKKVLHQYVIN